MQKLSVILFLSIAILSGCSLGNEDVDILAIFDDNLAEIDGFLARNGIDAMEDSSGIRFVINEMGEGPEINLQDPIFLIARGSTLAGMFYLKSLKMAQS